MKLEAFVSRHYNDLNPNDLIIWQYIYQHKDACLGLTIEALARRCNVSRTTVMRFAQKIGLSGYSELKACLRWEPEEGIRTESGKLVSIVCDSNVKAIRHYQAQNYDDICSLLYHAKRIFAYGTGQTQKSVCGEFQRMMLSLNRLVNYIPAEGELRKVIRLMMPGDVFLVVSKSGESEILRNMMFQLKSRDIPTISLTRYGNNTLAGMSTKNLFVNIEEVAVLDQTNFESMTLMFLILEILFAKLVEYREKALAAGDLPSDALMQ